MTVKTLELAPSNVPESSNAADTIKRLLSNLATITNGIAELRNQYGMSSLLGYSREVRVAYWALIESASSCHGSTDQWPDAAPDGEASTKTIGKSCCGGCRPSVTAFVGRP